MPWHPARSHLQLSGAFRGYQGRSAWAAVGSRGLHRDQQMPSHNAWFRQCPVSCRAAGDFDRPHVGGMLLQQQQGTACGQGAEAGWRWAVLQPHC